jgi:hypothetical protein
LLPIISLEISVLLLAYVPSRLLYSFLSKTVGLQLLVIDAPRLSLTIQFAAGSTHSEMSIPVHGRALVLVKLAILPEATSCHQILPVSSTGGQMVVQ